MIKFFLICFYLLYYMYFSSSVNINNEGFTINFMCFFHCIEGIYTKIVVANILIVLQRYPDEYMHQSSANTLFANVW